MSEPGTELAELRERIVEAEQRLDETQERRAALRDELAALPEPPSAEERAKDESRSVHNAWTAGMGSLFMTALAIAIYFIGIIPHSDFDEVEQRRMRAEIDSARDKAAKLEGALPVARKELSEDLAARASHPAPAGPDDFPCLGEHLRKARVDRQGNELALRWLQIGLAACKTGERDIAVSAFRILNKMSSRDRATRGDGGVGAPGLLGALLMVTCRQHYDIGLLGGLLQRQQMPPSPP